MPLQCCASSDCRRKRPARATHQCHPVAYRPLCTRPTNSVEDGERTERKEKRDKKKEKEAEAEKETEKKNRGRENRKDMLRNLWTLPIYNAGDGEEDGRWRRQRWTREG